MKKVIFTLTILILSVFIFASCGSDEEQPQNNDETVATSVFGSFSAKDLEGNTVDESVFAENKLTMVNIWATFCGPCINEMPHLGEIAQEYADKGVGIVGIVVDVADSRGSVNDNLLNEAVDIVSQTKADYLHIVPSPEMYSAKLNTVYSVPETIFVDSQGNQVGESYVGARSKAQWTAIIEELLGEVQ